ncbi:hypothetical protein [Actinokineospora spheciospongiae]|uniref:hypothetical protein n=1 Tax=Actinokineospora spheciospongiae TaxID=909613 RepID=UPI000D71A814|nr:hypothetical protein [Actinokineospora spheciospongiae]PWW64520.1 hypothetical protein DFQ13_103494 [Actinokineospora spheciospongiae]
MSSPSLDSYRELAESLNPTAVQQYLAANDWQLETQVPDIRQIWRLHDRARVMLPLATDYIDFAQRFRDTLRSLASVYDWDPVHLAEKIAATRADLFFVRIDQMMLDGTIPFRQAEKTLEGLFKMVKAAATTADDPTHSHRGRRSSTVNDFLDDDVRLGHTKRGSFVFTVVTRLGDSQPDHDDGTPAAAFPRRVMETLATGLHAARDLSLNWDAGTAENAAEHGLSASLVEALEDLTETGTLRELDLSFGWAVTAPPPNVPTSRIVVDRDAMAGLPRVRERLVRREEPPRTETLIGQVRSLTREEPAEGEQEESTIILVAEVHGRDRKVHIPLSGDDYTWAIFAHTNKLPFTVTGNLVFERRSWRLTDPITVDASFLMNQQTR